MELGEIEILEQRGTFYRQGFNDAVLLLKDKAIHLTGRQLRFYIINELKLLEQKYKIKYDKGQLEVLSKI